MALPITPQQILAAEAILKQHLTDPSLAATVFLQAYGAFLGATPAKAKPAAKNDSPDGFEEFYAVYPRKAARGDAVKAFCTALKKTTPDVLVAGAKRYAAEVQGAELKYVKYPATWLNAQCWTDQAPPLLRVVASSGRSPGNWDINNEA